MKQEEREELFEMLTEVTKKNSEDLQNKFLSALEVTENNFRQTFIDHTKHLDDRIDGLEGRFDNLEEQFKQLKTTVEFIKDFLLNNLVPRIEKLEAGYQYLLKLVTSK